LIDTPHEAANLVACQIVNLIDLNQPKAELYGRIYRLLLNMLFLAFEEQSERWKVPSKN
jgi:hypothetical protein